MSKKYLALIAIVLIILAGSVYLLSNRNTKTETPTSTLNPDDTQLSELPDDWITYTSPEWGFAINHPQDLKIELTQNGVHFFKLGETQATGTELFDGLSLLVFTASLNNISFENFVKQEYNKIKNEPVYESVSELEKAEVATYSGYKYTATGIGTSTTYFLQNGSDGYIKISDMTIEPNEDRDFHETVSQMLNTFQIVGRSTNSAENAPSGSLHNLPVPQAVTATKEFAAADFNVSINSILVLSAHEKEWPNACLGLEQPGEMCAQMITPGYEITIEGNGKQRVYRTNSDGSLIKIQE